MGIQRLASQFGVNAYSKERVRLIWQMVESFSSQWWFKTVDHWLMTERQAPLYDEFNEVVTLERERLAKQEKELHKKEAEEFWSGSLHDDDIKQVMKTIKGRITGAVPDAEWDCFIKMLDHIQK